MGTKAGNGLSLLYRQDFLEYPAPADTRVLVDTCVLVDASRSEEMKTFLEKMRGVGYEMRTIAPAWVEFLRVARTLAERKELRDFLMSLGIGCVDDNQKALFSSDGALFQMVLRRCKVNNPSYVDLLLLFVASLSNGVRLMTSNYRDVPLEFFDIDEMIVQYNEKGIQKTTYVYSFNHDNFNKMAIDIKV